MKKTLCRQFLILSLICISSYCVMAQTENYNAPVKWERYKVSDKSVSLTFPKLPILISSLDTCSEKATDQYAAYAEGVVYGLNVNYKSKVKAPDYCEEKRKFDRKSLQLGISEVKSKLKTERETKFNSGNREFLKIQGERFTYWLIDDLKNDRWFEVWVTTEDEENPSVKNFIESIKIGNNPSGIEIGKGADRTLGDALSTSNIEEEKKDDKSGNEETEPFRLILKQRANYTNAARDANVQGTVRLRVTFLASGGIGNVHIVSALPYGLTEQAYAAARKLVFIPSKKNGKFMSVTRVVEYSFSIF